MDCKFPADEAVELDAAGDDVASKDRWRPIPDVEASAQFLVDFVCEKRDLAFVVRLEIEKPVPFDAASGPAMQVVLFHHGMFARWSPVMTKKIVTGRQVEVLDPDRRLVCHHAQNLPLETNPANPNFAAALLAGGRSSRMGFDKAVAAFEGEPLWQRQLATLRELDVSTVLISGKRDGPYANGGVEVVEDVVPDLGPLGGLKALLDRCERDWLVVLGIDLPDIRADFLRMLMTTATRLGKGCVPKSPRGYEPLAAVYPRTLVPLVCECLDGPDRSMQHLLRVAESRILIVTHQLTPEEVVGFRNVNSPGDLR